MRSKEEIEKELKDAIQTHGFVLQYDPSCAPGWKSRIKELERELKRTN